MSKPASSKDDPVNGRTKRKYSRIPFDRAVKLVFLVSFTEKHAPARIFELGPGGCGISTPEEGLNKDDSAYIHLYDSQDQECLKICGRIAWKAKSPDDSGFKYGLEFLWIRRDPSQQVDEETLSEINEILRTTGYRLMPSG